jgi:hypothetical protein
MIITSPKKPCHAQHACEKEIRDDSFKVIEQATSRPHTRRQVHGRPATLCVGGSAHTDQLPSHRIIKSL